MISIHINLFVVVEPSKFGARVMCYDTLPFIILYNIPAARFSGFYEYHSLAGFPLSYYISKLKPASQPASQPISVAAM